MTQENPMIEIYTDGSSVDGQYGGYCALFVVTGEIFASRAFLTNQQAELMAIELAFTQVEDESEVRIYTDSAFAIGCLVRQFDLSASPWLKEIRDRICDDHIIHRHIRGMFIKVKGHSVDRYNHLCDRIALYEAYRFKQEMRSLNR
jgi:ribonuclease HI